MQTKYSARALAAAAFMVLAPASVMAQTTLAPRDVPAKTIPVPTDVSPQLQAVIAQPLNPGWNTPPTTPAGWQKLADQTEAATAPTVAPMAARLHVSIKEGTIGGVHVYDVTPASIPARNAHRLLIHVHGGCYVLLPHEAALPEAVMIAGYSHMRVISVDYRMPPQAYFPAALDDAMTVYKAALHMTKPKDIGVFGTSAGGALTLEMMLDAKMQHLPMPGAIAPSTPMADVSGPGDTFQTNALVDNVLVSPGGFCRYAAEFYAHGHSMSDPLISPVYGDYHGFPPAILTSGTRDLLLSNTVRVHQKMLQSGDDASLLVFEGMSHAQFMRDDRIPEDQAWATEVSAFLDKHLGH